MKEKSKIFSRLNLVLFLSSFLLLVVTTLQISKYTSNQSHTKAQFSQPNTGINSNGQQLSENNEFEDENDDDFEMTSFISPFLISFEQFEIIEAISLSIHFKTESFKEAVYLSVRNLRI